MKDFFASIYELFTSLYGEDLGLHLYGHNGQAYETNGGQALYTPIGLAMVLSSLLVVLIFYYAINRPSFNRWYHWLLMMGMAFLGNALAGFYVPYLDVEASRIATDLAVFEGNCVAFGFVNGLYSAVFFVLFSMALRWWSRNCSSTPFPN